MAVKNTAQVVIGGKIITLGGYESEEYFQKVAILFGIVERLWRVL